MVGVGWLGFVLAGFGAGPDTDRALVVMEQESGKAGEKVVWCEK